MVAFKLGLVAALKIKSEHVLDAFVRIKGKTIIPGPIRNELKSIVYDENALGIFTRVALKQRYIIAWPRGFSGKKIICLGKY